MVIVPLLSSAVHYHSSGRVWYLINSQVSWGPPTLRRSRPITACSVFFLCLRVIGGWLRVQAIPATGKACSTTPAPLVAILFFADVTVRPKL